ncbi:MAG: MmcQ/YjbR family DNA-binding protein [Sporichthyaceae bacterium]
MATWDDVQRLALALPETSERVGGHFGAQQWRVKQKLFVWDRPLGKGDRAALGDAAPDGPILAACVGDVEAKAALLAAGGPFFTTPHFDGYAIVLVRLAEIDPAELAEVVTDAWLASAPARVRRAFLADAPRDALE